MIYSKKQFNRHNCYKTTVILALIPQICKYIETNTARLDCCYFKNPFGRGTHSQEAGSSLTLPPGKTTDSVTDGRIRELEHVNIYLPEFTYGVRFGESCSISPRYRPRSQPSVADAPPPSECSYPESLHPSNPTPHESSPGRDRCLSLSY